jgi:hypothetical protein
LLRAVLYPDWELRWASLHLELNPARLRSAGYSPEFDPGSAELIRAYLSEDWLRFARPEFPDLALNPKEMCYSVLCFGPLPKALKAAPQKTELL